jgi:predicted HicB family RNase H-like nuclease
LAIALHPNRNQNIIKETKADDFISGAGKAGSAEPEADDSGRKPVVVRIPADLLKRIDQAAKRKSISRSSFIVSSMADLVNGDR